MFWKRNAVTACRGETALTTSSQSSDSENQHELSVKSGDCVDHTGMKMMLRGRFLVQEAAQRSCQAGGGR